MRIERTSVRVVCEYMWRKGCEQGCGVGCVLQVSLPYSEPRHALRCEAAGAMGRLRTLLAP